MAERTLSLLRRVWSLIRPYWKSEERWLARLLLTAIVGLSLGDVYLSVLFNEWHVGFYNALQNLDKPAFVHSIFYFCGLAAAAIIILVYKAYLGQMLRIKWRAWMTKRSLGHWLGLQNHYRMELFGSGMDNPDQRISEDIDQFIQLTLDLSLGLLSSVVTLLSFMTILWELSGALDFAFHGMKFHIPGYMLWVAIAYAMLGTWITFRIGRPLVGLNYNQQRFEANFRYSLIRLRENSESVAFYEGEAQEERGFVTRFLAIVGNWWQIMRRQKKLNWFTYGYAQAASVFPFIVGAPRYFSGQIKLGQLMQTVSAFNSVQGALTYLVDSFTTIATWKAVADRLSGFNRSIRKAEELREPRQGLTLARTGHNAVEACGLTVRLPEGTPLLEHIDLTVGPGDTLLITGRSGIGKSTLLRALAGLWPFLEGELLLPEKRRMLFVPQKPYLPLGTLAEALSYPGAVTHAAEELREILVLCRLEHLAGRLEETDQWSHILSLGEQQRLAFARTLLARPDFLFLDEATSALDEETESYLYGLLKERLPGSAVVSVGHRASLRKQHAREKALDQNA